MKNIVLVKNNDLVVSIQDVADFSNTKYESVQRLIRNYHEDFSELGLPLPKMAKGSSDFKSVLLNEPQATFLITLMKNNQTVRRFKLELVKQFYQMREKLCEVNRNQLETAQNEIKRLVKKKGKIYKDGRMALDTYIKDRELPITNETGWIKLIEEDVVGYKDVLVHRRFLKDDRYGYQKVTKDGNLGTIEFDSELLDEIFVGYKISTPTLF